MRVSKDSDAVANTLRTLVLVAIASLVCLNAAAQNPPVQQPPPPPATGQQAPPAAGQTATPPAGQVTPTPPTPEQLDFRELQAQPDPKAKIDLAEKFLVKYPESKATTYIYRLMMFSYQKLNDAAKCIEYGEKYMQLEPRDVEVLSLLAFVYGESKKVELATVSANSANQLLETFTPPAPVTAEQWKQAKAQLLSMNYATLGYCQLLRGRGTGDKEAQTAAFEDAVAFFRKALELNPMDDYSYVRMGSTYALMNKAAEALDSYAKAVVVGGNLAQTAREELQRVYKLTHQDSLNGLDDLLKKAADDLKKAVSPGA